MYLCFYVVNNPSVKTRPGPLQFKILQLRFTSGGKEWSTKTCSFFTSSNKELVQSIKSLQKARAVVAPLSISDGEEVRR
jgi:hypothetical protein